MAVAAVEVMLDPRGSPHPSVSSLTDNPRLLTESLLHSDSEDHADRSPLIKHDRRVSSAVGSIEMTSQSGKGDTQTTLLDDESCFDNQLRVQTTSLDANGLDESDLVVPSVAADEEMQYKIRDEPEIRRARSSFACNDVPQLVNSTSTYQNHDLEREDVISSYSAQLTPDILAVSSSFYQRDCLMRRVESFFQHALCSLLTIPSSFVERTPQKERNIEVQYDKQDIQVKTDFDKSFIHNQSQYVKTDTFFSNPQLQFDQKLMTEYARYECQMLEREEFFEANEPELSIYSPSVQNAYQGFELYSNYTTSYSNEPCQKNEVPSTYQQNIIRVQRPKTKFTCNRDVEIFRDYKKTLEKHEEPEMCAYQTSFFREEDGVMADVTSVLRMEDIRIALVPASLADNQLSISHVPSHLSHPAPHLVSRESIFDFNQLQIEGEVEQVDDEAAES